MAGGANHSRLVSLTYPNGRVVNYNYAAGTADAVSRVTSVSDNSGTLEAYSYLGAATVVVRSCPQTGVDLSYVKRPSDPTGDAGDPYTGLDGFGRVAEQRWWLPATGAATDDFLYYYDQDSNLLARDNWVNLGFGELYHASGAGQGEDGLNQLTSFQRGTLTGSGGGPPTAISGTPSHVQGYTLDAQGNVTGLTTDGTTQTRQPNLLNQLPQVGGAPLTYDGNGNLTKDETGKTFTYDSKERARPPAFCRNQERAGEPPVPSASPKGKTSCGPPERHRGGVDRASTRPQHERTAWQAATRPTARSYSGRSPDQGHSSPAAGRCAGCRPAPTPAWWTTAGTPSTRSATCRWTTWSISPTACRRASSARSTASGAWVSASPAWAFCTAAATCCTASRAAASRP
jgi:hypothetical protein